MRLVNYFFLKKERQDICYYKNSSEAVKFHRCDMKKLKYIQILFLSQDDKNIIFEKFLNQKQ